MFLEKWGIVKNNSLSEISIGEQKIYTFKDNYAFSSPERDKWIEICYDYDVVVIQLDKLEFDKGV